MNLLSKTTKHIQTLLFNPKHKYHILSLLQSKNEAELIKINPKLFHLYLHKLTHQPFNQRYIVLLLMDCYRTSQSSQQFSIIVQYALANLQSFTSRISLVTMLNQMYHYRYQNKEDIIKVTIKALSIPEIQDSSFYNLKLLIAFDYLVGLQALPETHYRNINFKKFRPLTLTMVIEMFYIKGLQKQYKLVEELVDIFIECQTFVPFADVHHLAVAIRKIDNARYKQCFYRIRKRIQASVGGKKQTKNDDEAQPQKHEQIQTQQKIDLTNKQNKKVDVSSLWTTQDQFVQKFRQLINTKYSY